MKRRATWLTLTPLWPLIRLYLIRPVKGSEAALFEWRIFSAALAAGNSIENFSVCACHFFRSRRTRLRDETRSIQI
jgi:hypothetical protein